MLIEFYFHNILCNSIIDNMLIVPETYKYGKVILDTSNEILYFYEMEYYDSMKYVFDNINNLENENKSIMLTHFYAILKMGHNALHNMESRISTYHIDNNYDPNICKTQEMIIGHLTSTNMFVYNDKCVLIDFGDATRRKETTHLHRHQLERYINEHFQKNYVICHNSCNFKFA